jgi:hypothetical protein
VVKLALLAIVIAACGDPTPPASAAPKSAPARPAPRSPYLTLGLGEDPALAAEIEQVRAANHIPAVAIAVLRGRMGSLAVAGTLPGASAPLSTTDPIEIHDRLGVTASVAARLVDRGRLHWDDVDRQLGVEASLVSIVERAGGKPWPDLVRDEVFVPLGMRSCTATANGTLRCSITDWAHYAAAQAGGFAGNWLTAISHDHIRHAVTGPGDTILAFVPPQSAVAVVAIGQAPGTVAAAKQIVDAQLARMH